MPERRDNEQTREGASGKVHVLFASRCQAAFNYLEYCELGENLPVPASLISWLVFFCLFVCFFGLFACSQKAGVCAFGLFLLAPASERHAFRVWSLHVYRVGDVSGNSDVSAVADG